MMAPLVSAAVSTKPTAMTIRSTSGDDALLEIYFDGTITWNGPPSKASRLFLSSIRGILDLDTIGNMAAERIYRRSVARILNMARSMPQEEFIDRLEQELQARQSKAVLLELRKGSNERE